MSQSTKDALADAETLRRNWNDHSPFSDEATCNDFGVMAAQFLDASLAVIAARAAFRAVPGLREVA